MAVAILKSRLPHIQENKEEEQEEEEEKNYLKFYSPGVQCVNNRPTCLCVCVCTYVSTAFFMQNRLLLLLPYTHTHTHTFQRVIRISDLSEMGGRVGATSRRNKFNDVNGMREAKKEEEEEEDDDFKSICISITVNI